MAPDFRQPGGASGRGSSLSTLRLHSDQTFDTFALRTVSCAAGSARQPAHALRTLGAAASPKTPTGWLVFTGDFGCGKTHLAAAIANHQVTPGRASPIFVVVPELLDHLRATFSPNSATTLDRLFEQVKNAPLLVLDDLGTESATPWAQEKLFQLLNHRYAARLPTVITTSNRSTTS